MKNRIYATLMMGVLLAAVSCGKEKQKPVEEKVPVTVAVAEVKDIPVQIRAIGSVEPFSNVGIKSLVGGNLERVSFQEGQDVRRGQLLFTIDPRPYQSEMAQARAGLARDEANLRNAESQAARYAGLVQKDYVTREESDKFSTAAAAARAVVAADRAAVENSRLMLSYCEIRSPIDGRTGGLMVHAGNIVRPNDVTPMVVINQVTPIYARFSVPEAQLPMLRSRMKEGTVFATASPQGGGVVLARGRLTFVDNAVDTTTGTIALKATFDNATRSLWPGQFVNVAITVQNLASAVVVPAQAIQASQKGPYVYVVRQDKSTEMRPVTVVQTVDQQAVVGHGVAGGETVVIDGQLRITPKSRVEVKKAF